MAIHFLLLPALVVGLISSPRLVVLIPAYNEADRIEKTLESYEQFLTSSPLWQNNCEIVVVDDGSKDETVLKVKDFTSNILIQCISLDTNQGKGSALARGINYIQETTKANNEPKSIIILTQDADGSGDLKYLEDMYRKLQELLDSSTKEEEVMVMGNRNYNLFSSRGITRWGFQTCVSIIMGGLGVQDSQCGYKLMTLSTATRLYKDLNLNGWVRTRLVDYSKTSSYATYSLSPNQR
jgi:dolichyl-phosphate beta-glucosyltransferase